MLRHGAEAQVYQFGHLDRSTGKLYVNDFAGGIFLIETGGITHRPNGSDGVLFETFSSAEQIQYVPISNRVVSRDDFFSEINFDSRSPLTLEAYCWLLRIWFYSIFVPELHRTRAIPLFIGQQGSGKTTCARRLGILLMGSNFNVAHLETKDRGEQAFIAAVCGSPFIAFDNADAPVSWLADHLARYATGVEFNLRELYTTNKLSTFHPIATVVLTARDPQFRRPDVAERLLIFPLSRLEKFKRESALFDETVRFRDSLFSEIIDNLQKLLPTFLDPESISASFRMADFAEFGHRVMRSEGRESEFSDWLRVIETTQAGYATEDDPLINLVDCWLKTDSNIGREIETGQLFLELQKLGDERHVPMVKSASALGKRLRDLETVLHRVLGTDVMRTRIGNTTRWRFGGPEPAGSLNFQSSHSPDSLREPGELPFPDSRPEPGIGEMSEMGEFSETQAARQTPEGEWICQFCGSVFGTSADWKAHIFQKRCPGRN